MRRTKEEAARTRATILATAEQLFIDRGYESVSLEQIAATCALTRGAVHWHFKNKLGLLSAIREGSISTFSALAEDARSKPTPPGLQDIREAIIDVFRQLQASPQKRGLTRVMLHAESSLSAESRSLGFETDIRELFTEILEAAKPCLKEPWNPACAAAALRGTMVGLLQEWAFHKGDFDLVRHGSIVIDQLIDTMGQPARETHA